MAFPISPIDRQIFKDYIYNSTKQVWEKSVLNKTYPVGSFYVQYPSAESNVDSEEFPSSQQPSVLFGGTWEEKWSTESIYFRTNGSDSDVDRTLGKQEDAMKEHKHQESNIYSPVMLSPYGAVGSPYSTKTVQDRGASNGPQNLTSNPVGASSTTPDQYIGKAETRVKNRRIKIWKRIL